MDNVDMDLQESIDVNKSRLTSMDGAFHRLNGKNPTHVDVR
jgi:hypothetical protein